MSPVPLLVISDSPTAGTGLGRITNDICSRVFANLSDIYRLATCGYGGISSRLIPWHHYAAEGMDGWIMPTLPEIWNDWAGEEKGIILFISDPARLNWFSRPEMSAEMERYPKLKDFLLKPSFQKWIYAPIDAGGPNDRLTYPLQQSLLGFDRILAYGKFGEDVIRNTLGEQESKKRYLTSLPHGINTSVFYPRDKKSSRAFFYALTGAATIFGKQDLINSDETLIGCVATNQSRKDYGMALEAVSLLSRERKIRLWIHTDQLERVGAWSIPALLADFGLLDRTVISLGQISDEMLAKAYSACDVTIAPGVEGWGFPIAESLACRVPVCHGSYGGGADILPKYMQVDPVAFRFESIWSCTRPVYCAKDWADKIHSLYGVTAFLESKYNWNENWKAWEQWFREGIR